MQLLLRVAVSVHPQRALLVDLALPAEEEDIADGTVKATEICWRGQTHVFPAACEGPTFFFFVKFGLFTVRILQNPA